MSLTLGIDVGTNSLGMIVRDDERSDNPQEQIVYQSVNTFPSGVGKEKSVEYSLAAQRTRFRQTRRTYKVRRYRKWAVLRLLIKHGLCPLDIESLDKWRKYDKHTEQKRIYPANHIAFQKWLRCDFEGECSLTTPYKLRNQLATEQMDFDKQVNLYKLGRALYHIAVRRGFKSSKGETLASSAQEDDDDIVEEKKASESLMSDKLESFRHENGYPTVGCALYHLIENRIRVRGSEYKAVRSDFKDEIDYIFEFQDGLTKCSDLYKGLVSQKKYEGTIFYKNPLKTQKGNVGKCLLEPSKNRCSQCRPEFEEFRAWSLINNIKFGEKCEDTLSIEQKERLFANVFVCAKDFKFEKIRKWIESETHQGLKYSIEKSNRTINYDDTATVSACSIIYRLKELLGDNWKMWYIDTDNTHTKNNDRTLSHNVRYTWEDIWHICATFEDTECLKKWHESKCSVLDYKKLEKLWNEVTSNYGQLSLKAINNINHFLKKGLIYSEACLLAKLPDIFGDKWTEDIENKLVEEVHNIIICNHEENKIIDVANNLIASYKAQPLKDRHQDHDFSYELTEYDFADINKAIIDTYGSFCWNNFSNDKQEVIKKSVANYYQSFFADSRRVYISRQSLDNSVKTFLKENYNLLDDKAISKLYHHSAIEHYPKAKDEPVTNQAESFLQSIGDTFVERTDLHFKLLGSPALPSLRNPMALRVLHTLRGKINELIINGIINTDDTRIVIEVTRELNDANMRWAIDKHNKINEEKNNIIKEKLREENLLSGQLFAEQRMLKAKDDEKLQKLAEELDDFHFFSKNEKKYLAELHTKYKLWLEQDCCSVYTGEPISFTDLCDGNKTNIDHTLPISRSFDDSLTNKTVCESYYNQKIKGNKMPSELKDEYATILMHIKPWEEKVERLKRNIQIWRHKSQRAVTKEEKDRCIRQRHLWELEYDYWNKKVNTFHAKEITKGFRNSQLVDTSIIAKYSHLYLKSVFNRVEVQRGEVTAHFRNILQIAPKTRDFHSHHAIDAYVLTLIPVAPVRDRILELYFKKMDAKNLCHSYADADIDNQIKNELSLHGVNISNCNSVVEYILKNVLVQHRAKQQYLTPASRRHRERGKIVPLRDSNGDIIYEKDRFGHNIPKPDKWLRGDCVRGELHKQSLFGRISINGEDKYVKRRDLREFENLKELENCIVDKSLFEEIKEQVGNGSYKSVCEKGIYLTVKKDKKKGRKKGERIRIRHIRCFVDSKNPIAIRKHEYVSKHEYKQYVYADNASNIAYALYENEGKRSYECYSLFKAAAVASTEGIRDIPSLFPTYKDVKGKIYKKKFVLVYGQMVLLRKDEEKISDIISDSEITSARLYRFVRVFDPNKGILQLQHHLEARNDAALKIAYPKETYKSSGTNGFSEIDFKNPRPRLLLSMKNQNFWIEGRDFVFRNGKIEVLNAND